MFFSTKTTSVKHKLVKKGSTKKILAKIQPASQVISVVKSGLIKKRLKKRIKKQLLTPTRFVKSLIGQWKYNRDWRE